MDVKGKRKIGAARKNLFLTIFFNLIFFSSFLSF